MTLPRPKVFTAGSFTFRVHQHRHGIVIEHGPQLTTMGWDTVRQLQDFLNDYVPPATPPDDPRVTELIEAAKTYVQWQITEGIPLTSMSEQLQRLNRASVAFDPPDPDAELVEKVKRIWRSKTLDDGPQAIINTVRAHDIFNNGE